jgi:DNA-binding response OmpR family regulator
MATRIVVVDDSRTTRDQVAQLLRGAGFNVVTCANGEDALKESLREKPDLVVSDVQMPICDGFTLCEALKSSQDGADVPFLLLTRLEDPTAILRGLQAGADGFLMKSGGLQTLVPRVKKALAEKNGDAARRKTAASQLSAKLKLTDGRKEMFRVLFDSMTREAPFDLLALLAIGKDAKTPLVLVSRAPLSEPLAASALSQMTKTASLLSGGDVKVEKKHVELIALDESLPPIELTAHADEAIKVPLWDQGSLIGELGIFDLSGQEQIEANIRYFFDLGIEFARALQGRTTST